MASYRCGGRSSAALISSARSATSARYSLHRASRSDDAEQSHPFKATCASKRSAQRARKFSSAPASAAMARDRSGNRAMAASRLWSMALTRREGAKRCLSSNEACRSRGNREVGYGSRTPATPSREGRTREGRTRVGRTRKGRTGEARAGGRARIPPFAGRSLRRRMRFAPARSKAYRRCRRAVNTAMRRLFRGPLGGIVAIAVGRACYTGAEDGIALRAPWEPSTARRAVIE